MISNLQLLQSANHHLSDPLMSPSFKSQILSLTSQQYRRDEKDIEPHRTTSDIDPFATLLFPQAALTFYKALRIADLHLCTFSSAASKRGDDSTVVFRIGDEIRMGRIQSIFSIATNGNVFLIITYPTSIDRFTCAIDDDEDFTSSSMYSCLKKDFSCRLVQTTEIIEKSVYFEHPDGKCYFLRFPNLEHSS